MYGYKLWRCTFAEISHCWWQQRFHCQSVIDSGSTWIYFFFSVRWCCSFLFSSLLSLIRATLSITIQFLPPARIGCIRNSEQWLAHHHTQWHHYHHRWRHHHHHCCLLSSSSTVLWISKSLIHPSFGTSSFVNELNWQGLKIWSECSFSAFISELETKTYLSSSFDSK